MDNINLLDQAGIEDEMKKTIMDNVNITKENLFELQEALRQWISHQHHFPQVKIGDEFLDSFVISCKGNLERAKSKLDSYFTSRSKYPDIFTNRDPTDELFLRYAKLQPLTTLMGRTDEGYRVHVTWLRGPDYDVTSWIKRVVSQWEVLLMTDPWSAGEIFLVSGTNFTFSHAAKLTPNDVATMFSLVQKVYPLRVRAIWFYNAPPACEFIVNKVLKPVISKKLSERIQVHCGDERVLLEHFPINILPQDYGGEAGKLCELNEWWLDKISKYRRWFIEDAALTTDETKRPSGTVDSFGSIAGSFKKLQID